MRPTPNFKKLENYRWHMPPNDKIDYHTKAVKYLETDTHGIKEYCDVFGYEIVECVLYLGYLRENHKDTEDFREEIEERLAIHSINLPPPTPAPAV